MSVVLDILRTYRAPKAIIAQRIGATQREDRALAVLMGACIVAYIAQWPRFAREAHLMPEIGLDARLAAGLFGFVMVLPLLFYLLSLVLWCVEWVVRSGVTAYEVRMALFWSFLAATPLLLFSGLVAGFIGAGPLLNIISSLPIVAFLLFFLAGRSSRVGASV